MKISVIIPMYGVEPYIAQCARSLFEQSFTDQVEYLFIDDASKDNSVEVLRNVIDEYANQNLNIRIIQHENNLGLPSARNTGLKHARGEYIMHVDGDDFLEVNAIEMLYKAARDNDADVVWCDYYITTIAIGRCGCSFVVEVGLFLANGFIGR